MNNIITKAIRADLEISNTVSIDCYLFPNGEKRIGITGASKAIGRADNYLGRLQKSAPKRFKALREHEYTGYLIEAEVDNERGASRIQTISKRDFTKLFTWDAIANQRKESIILLAAFAESGLDKILDDLFAGRSVEFLLEKIVHYTQWTNEDLQKALVANYEDWQIIEEQERFLELA